MRIETLTCGQPGEGLYSQTMVGGEACAQQQSSSRNGHKQARAQGMNTRSASKSSSQGYSLDQCSQEISNQGSQNNTIDMNTQDNNTAMHKSKDSKHNKASKQSNDKHQVKNSKNKQVKFNEDLNTNHESNPDNDRQEEQERSEPKIPTYNPDINIQDAAPDEEIKITQIHETDEDESSSDDSEYTQSQDASRRTNKDKIKPKNNNTKQALDEAPANNNSESQQDRNTDEQYSLFNDDTYTQSTKHKNITIYREDVYAKDIDIDDINDFSLATFLMNNRVGMWIEKGNFADSMEVEWKVVPIKVKRLTRGDSKVVAVEAIFVDYRCKQPLTPDLRNWRLNICTLMMSYEGRNKEIMIREMIKKSYPEAITLSDLINIVNHDNVSSEATTQTSGRICTFPIPIPTSIRTESVTMGEAEVKESLKAISERWHARLGHASDDMIRNTAKAYQQFKIPHRYRTDPKIQPEKCVCCQKCKASLKHKIKRSSIRACKYLVRVHMDVCGPLQMKTSEGQIYFTIFYDEYTRYRWGYLHRDRTQSVEILKRFLLDASKGSDMPANGSSS
jgi:hypothetical protein